MEKEFLNKEYKVPEAPSNYMRFQDGINRFRILSEAEIGFEYFSTENKPVRSEEVPEATPDIKKNGRVKHFWAFVVYNYQTETIQILEITQKTIMNSIKALLDNPKWGSVFSYDLAVARTGEGLDTTYNVQPEPPIEEPSEEILKAYKEKPVNLKALFSNQDPFEKEIPTVE